jgi:transcriptional regulator with XRE-family HTH domain
MARPRQAGDAKGARAAPKRRGARGSAAEPATPRSPQSVDWSPYQVGQALRALRLTRGMSINDLARQSDLSASFLSQVENGQSDLSVGRLMRVSQALGVTPADVLNVPAPDSKPVVRAGERLKLPMAAKGVHVYMLAPTIDKKRTFSYGILEPGASIAMPVRNRGSEYFVYVIEGAMRLEYTSGEVLTLEAGDSASHISDDSRAIANASDGSTIFLWSQAART